MFISRFQKNIAKIHFYWQLYKKKDSFFAKGKSLLVLQ